MRKSEHNINHLNKNIMISKEFAKLIVNIACDAQSLQDAQDVVWELCEDKELSVEQSNFALDLVRTIYKNVI